MASIELNTQGHVAEVLLNRPGALNAIDDEMDRALAAAWARIDGDPDIRVAVLRGAGARAFCAGADIAAPPTGHGGLSFGGGLTGIGGRLQRLRKPLLCAVHGHVLGLGFELAMCADIIVAADDARFGLPEARAGIIDHCGVVHRAVRQLPHHVAMAMIVASQTLDAMGAAQYGLINEVVPIESMDTAVQKWIDKILGCAPLVSQAAKQAALEGLNSGLEEALAARYRLIDLYSQTEDYQEAMRAWKERRPPKWIGR